jgi:hypothetical protein
VFEGNQVAAVVRHRDVHRLAYLARLGLAGGDHAACGVE